LSLIGEPKCGGLQAFDFVNRTPRRLVRSRYRQLRQPKPDFYKGETAGGLTHYESDGRQPDERRLPGLIAEWASYPSDYSSVTFKLRDEARWHDGTKIAGRRDLQPQANKAANPRMGPTTRT
jgi:microcin C transport system substrate-binding protein